MAAAAGAGVGARRDERKRSLPGTSSIVVNAAMTQAMTEEYMLKAARQFDRKVIQNVLRMLFSPTNKKSVVSVILFVALVGLAIGFYGTVEKMEVFDCVWFSIVVVNTVGYGDFYPVTTEGKIFTVFFVHLALVILAFAISNLIDVVSLAVHAAKGRALREARLDCMQLSMEDGKVGLFDKKTQRKQKQLRFARAVGCYAVVVVIGWIVFALGEPWEAHANGSMGGKWVNGLYLAVITLTTVGFGDMAPSTPSMKVVGALLMLFGIPLCAFALKLMTDMIFGEGKEKIKLMMVQGLTSEKFDSMHEFCQELASIAAGDEADLSDGKIDRFEFLCFMLVKNGVIEMRNIEDAMKNFNELDKTRNGYLEYKDLPGASLESSLRSSTKVSPDIHRVVEFEL